MGMAQVHDQKLMLPEFMNVNTKLQMISVQEIGAFAAIAFNRPEEYKGRRLKLPGTK